ncbi:MAG: HD domain-containing protein [bacterium]|nr:HD domain-containing protein [bacterium]
MVIKFPELLGALSQALDITEGQIRGHSHRTAYIAIKIGQLLNLSKNDIIELYQAALLKDSGCSSNAVRVFHIFNNDDLITKRNVKFVDWSNFFESSKFALKFVKKSNFFYKIFHLYKETNLSPKVMDDLTYTRCTNGSRIASYMGFSNRVCKAIECLDEHWDGRGSPYKLIGESIPLFSRILCLSQTLEVFVSAVGLDGAYEVIKNRKGKWFDPKLVDVAFSFKQDSEFWELYKRMLENPGFNLSLIDIVEELNIEDIDRICEGFAMIVDAKSSYTYQHSYRVAQYALMIAEKIGFEPSGTKFVYRAGLLHDLGKLGIPSFILEKPAKLTSEEFEIVKLHTKYTYDILSCIKCFEDLADIASAHHEKLDGSGYHRGLKASDLKLESRILAGGDVFDALYSERPYRSAMPIDKVFRIMEYEMKNELDQEIVKVLKDILNVL